MPSRHWPHRTNRKATIPVFFVAAFMSLAACSQSAPPDGAAAPAADRGGPTAQEEEAPSKKRAAPRKVQAVEHAGVRYSELRGGRGRGLTQNGGYIVAQNLADGQELWIARIYDCSGDGDMERDKTDVYIERIELVQDGQALLITDERNRHYQLDLRDRSVTALGH